MTHHDHIAPITLPPLKPRRRLMGAAPFDPREHSHYWTDEEARAHLAESADKFCQDSAGWRVASALAAAPLNSWADLTAHLADHLTPDDIWAGVADVERLAPDLLPFWIVSPKLGVFAKTWTMDERLSSMARAVGAILLEATCCDETVDALEVLDWLSVTTAAHVLGALAELRALYPNDLVTADMRRARPSRVALPARIWALANRAAGEACGEEDERFKRVVGAALNRNCGLSPQARLVVAARYSEKWPPRDAEELGSWIGLNPGDALAALWETNNGDIHGPASIPEWAAAHTCDGWNAKVDRAVVASPLTSRLALGVSSQLRLEGPWPASTLARDLAAAGWMTAAEVVEGAIELKRAGLHHIHPWPASLAEQVG